MGPLSPIPELCNAQCRGRAPPTSVGVVQGVSHADVRVVVRVQVPLRGRRSRGRPVGVLSQPGGPAPHSRQPLLGRAAPTSHGDPRRHAALGPGFQGREGAGLHPAPGGTLLGRAPPRGPVPRIGVRGGRGYRALLQLVDLVVAAGRERTGCVSLRVAATQ